MRPIVTDGVTASSDHRSREFGISCSASSLKFCCDARVRGVDDRRGAGDRHGLLQRRDARARRSPSRVKPIEIWMFSRFSVLKPGSSNVTV